MQVAAIEISTSTLAAQAELLDQLEQQCIQTLEFVVLREPKLGRTGIVRIAPHFGDHLDPQLLELLV